MQSINDETLMQQYRSLKYRIDTLNEYIPQIRDEDRQEAEKERLSDMVQQKDKARDELEKRGLYDKHELWNY